MTEKVNKRIDELEAIMLGNFPVVDCPVSHSFTPGLYIRKIFMPAGVTVTSMIHKTIHPFCVMQGKVTVYSENDGIQEIEAPFDGITYPGTRRVLRVHENTVWVTFHPTEIKPKDDSDESIKEAVDLICEEIIDLRPNDLVGGVIRNNEVLQHIKSKEEESFLFET